LRRGTVVFFLSERSGSVDSAADSGLHRCRDMLLRTHLAAEARGRQSSGWSGWAGGAAQVVGMWQAWEHGPLGTARAVLRAQLLDALRLAGVAAWLLVGIAIVVGYCWSISHAGR